MYNYLVNRKGFSLIVIVFSSGRKSIEVFLTFGYKSKNHKETEKNLSEKEIPKADVHIKEFTKEDKNDISVTLYEFDQELVTSKINTINKESLKPKATLNTSNWVTWGNSDLKIEFKYPPEWGEPSVRLTDMTKFDSLSSGWSSSINFKNNSDLRIEGVSQDFERPMGFHGFKGFKKGAKRGETPEIFCENNKDTFLLCNTTKNSALVVTTKYNCHFKDRWYYQPYNVNFYLDLPSDVVISGFQLKSPFLSKKYIDQSDNDFSDLTCASHVVSDITDNSIEFYKEFNKAILERRLDEESMNNYDTLVEFYNSIKILN